VRNIPLRSTECALGPGCERLAAAFAEQIYSPAEDPQKPVQLTDAEPYD